MLIVGAAGDGNTALLLELLRELLRHAERDPTDQPTVPDNI